MNSLVIGIDFDSTCVKHSFPELGENVPHAVRVLKKLVKNGHKLLLFTCRSDIQNPVSDDPNIIAIGGDYLTEAENWFKDNGIELWASQRNPEQDGWTTSPKAYFNLLIDDTSVGMPLVYSLYDRPYVDWREVEKILKRQKIIK